MQEEKREPRLLVEIERPYGGDFLHVEGRLVYVSAEDGKLKNFNADSFGRDRQESELADLVIHAQGDLTPREPVVQDSLYGYSVGYEQVYRADLERVEIMRKLLRKVDRHLTKMQDNFGYAHSYAEYMIRVCNALRVNEFGFRPADVDDRWHGSADAYRWVGPSSLEGVLHYELGEVRKRFGVLAGISPRR